MTLFLAFVFKLSQPKARPRNLALHSVFHVPNLCVIFVCLVRESHLHFTVPFLVVETVRSLRREKICIETNVNAKHFVNM